MTKQLLRVNVTVTEHQHTVLMHLGKLQGRSAASFLREMLDLAMPMLEASIPVWEAAANEAAAQPERLRRTVEEALLKVREQTRQADMLALMLRNAPGANDPGAEQGEPSVARANSSSPASSNKRARR